MRVRLTPGQLTAFSTRVALQLDVHSFVQRRTDVRRPYFTQPAPPAELPSPADVHLFSELEGGFVVGALPFETAEAAAEQRRLEVPSVMMQALKLDVLVNLSSAERKFCASGSQDCDGCGF